MFAICLPQPLAKVLRPFTRSVISTHNLLGIRRPRVLRDGWCAVDRYLSGRFCETGQPENRWFATMSNDSTPIESTDSEWRIVLDRNAFQCRQASC
jgi:hypothetical protein